METDGISSLPRAYEIPEPPYGGVLKRQMSIQLRQELLKILKELDRIQRGAEHFIANHACYSTDSYPFQTNLDGLLDRLSPARYAVSHFQGRESPSSE